MGTANYMVCPRFFNLAAMHEYIEPLREEAVRALVENDGVLTARALQSMKKMDSFLKETMRLNPASMGGFKKTDRCKMASY